MLSVEDLSNKSSEAAFTAENVVSTSRAHEARLQTCGGIEESCRDFHLPKNPQKVAQSEDTNMMSGNQQELAMMAQKHAVTAETFDGIGAWLALPENPQGVKKGRKYKRKQFSFSPLGDSEKKNVTAEQDEGIRIDENSEKSHIARERKKSKYLSYPYVDPTDEANAGKDESKDVSNLKTETDKAKIINLTSAEMLSKLCMTAQSGSFSMERKHTGPAKSFFSYFRRFCFSKLEDGSFQELFDSELHISRGNESLDRTDDPEEQNDEVLMEYPTSGGKVQKFRKSTDNTSTDIGFSYPLKNCLIGLVERVSLETVSDVSKSMTVDKQRKGKTVSGADKLYPTKCVTGDKKRKGKRGSVVKEANPITSMTVSGMNEAYPVNKVLEFNSNIITSSAEGSKHTEYVAASANPCTTNNPELSGISGNRVTFVQLLNDVQAGAPKLLQSIVEENKEGVQSSFISESGQSEAEVNQVESASFGKNFSLEAQCVPSGFVPQHKVVGEKLKVEELKFSDNNIVVSAPNGNGIVAESNSINNKQIASSHYVPARKRKGRNKKEEALNIPCEETNGIEPLRSKETPIKRRVKKNTLEAGNSQNKSAAILLNFTSGFSLPSIETILQAFSGFGIINKSETRFVNDSAAQVVFVQSTNAKEAFKSLKTNNPFGPVLGNYLLQPLSALATDNNKLQIQPSFPEMNGINVLPTPPGMNSKDGDSPNLVFIKQKLEMMTSMLEKAGSNLSAEMRAKLESEIKSFTGKVNSMVGSSSFS